MKNVIFSVMIMLFWQTAYGQVFSNWKTADTTLYNANDTAKIWRSGGVAISSWIRNPGNSKFLVTTPYIQKSTRGAYLSINEPDWYEGNPAKIGLATDTSSTYTGLVVNHFTNFKQGVYFKDVHNSSLESNFIRGTTDTLGFQDGGRLRNGYTARLSATFNNNGRPHVTDEFDLLNLRLFTGNTAGNIAEVTNFYGIRLDFIRGVNPAIIKTGWGVYIVPSILKNYFGGNVGIGTTNVTHALTVQAVSDPIKAVGLQEGNDKQLVTVDVNGVLHKKSVAVTEFQVTYNNTTLSDDVQLYIHKGGTVTYTLPIPSLRAGKSWKIVNIGTGTITLSQSYYEGNALRTDILNVAGGYTREIFSDGTSYIAIK
ncbi:hypothetical protein [Runella sp.]|uniref:hypothetical protein n=1 Tax=Runella sp. TaxID=1960881 RepID=UPI003D11D566